MGALWDDRLAEVWASPGRQGSGVVVGTRSVLTARHVVDGSGGDVKARSVRRTGARPGLWVPMHVVWEDPEWDLALLTVPDGEFSTVHWLVPTSSSPRIVRVGRRAESGCETVGFPDQEAQRTVPEGRIVRQTEQVSGILLPSGQAKPPVGPGRPLPRSWMPLDAATSTASTADRWGGMSGAGVILADGGLAAIVVAADRDHQLRRLYCVPLAEVLDSTPAFAEALAAAVGESVVVPRIREASEFRRTLMLGCLAADGSPARLDSIDDLGVFGVKVVDLKGEPPFLNYVARDHDNDLDRALSDAVRTRRLLLIAGKSGAGKSRSAAEAVRRRFPGHRLLRPVEGMLSELSRLPLDDLGATLVWLDDIERYQTADLRDTLRKLLASGSVVVGTVRTDELAAITATHSPAGETLTDPALVARLDWQREWSEAERVQVPRHVAHPDLRRAVAQRIALGVWCVAGPQLIQRSLDTEPDDYPCRSALLRVVLDWYRTGLTTPIPRLVAFDLVEALTDPAEPDDLDEALAWALAPVSVGGRRSTHSLLSADSATDTLTVNDYVQDHDHRGAAPPVPAAVWEAAINAADGDLDALASIGWRALEDDQDVARRIFAQLAEAGNAEGMGLFGVLLLNEDAEEARAWMLRAAETGSHYALANYGTQLRLDGDPAGARHWYELAVDAGSTRAMYELGTLLWDEDPVAAREWLRRAADAGESEAMSELGFRLGRGDPGQAVAFYERAAEAGNLTAMNNLGLTLADQDPDMALAWFRSAAEQGNVEAMRNLGTLLAMRDDRPGALEWLHRAAKAGHTEAMRILGLQLEADGLDAGARHWLTHAARKGNSRAMLNVALLAQDEDDADGYLTWITRGVEAGDTACMFTLGVRLSSSGRAEEARSWLLRAAEELSAAATMLGELAEERDEALYWLRRAAEAGEPRGMRLLGDLLADHGELGEAREWWTRAAEADDATAATTLGRFLARDDPGAALPWLLQAAEADDADAMAMLAELLSASDPPAAARWRRRADRPLINESLYVLTTDPDPHRRALLDAVRDWTRTDVGVPLPRGLAFDLAAAYLPAPAPPQAMENALLWALSPIIVEGRPTGIALLYEEKDGLRALEIAGLPSEPVPDPVWDAALAGAGDDASRRHAVGWSALREGRQEVARRAFRPLAEGGHTESMGIYGLLLKHDDPETAAHMYEQAALTGIITDALNYGNFLAERGDVDGATFWLRRAAAEGNVPAMASLGEMLIDVDPYEAESWLRRAADAGFVEAINAMGLLMGDEDPRAAREWFRDAAYRGDPSAMNNLGLGLADEDPDAARLWFEQAAEAGLGEAMRNLAVCLIDEEPAEARHWLERAASQGNAAAMFTLAALLWDEDPDAARLHVRQAAERGYPAALHALASESVEADDLEGAKELLVRAVAADHAESMTGLAALLADEGQLEEAIELWKRAASLGDRNAMYGLGLIQYSADDHQGADFWWRQAADLGDPAAMMGIAALLEDEDPDAAQEWAGKAWDAGFVPDEDLGDSGTPGSSPDPERIGIQDEDTG